MCNSPSRDIRKCTTAGSQFHRVEQENHNPFTGAVVSRRASAGRPAERSGIYDFLTTCRLLPAGCPAILVEYEYHAGRRRRHAAIRSLIGLGALAAPGGFPPIRIRRVRGIQLSDGLESGLEELGRAAKAV